MLNTRFAINNVLRLLWNLLMVYVAYSVCRLAFVLTNARLYADVPLSHWADLFRAGLIFDSSAICYTNALVTLLTILPLHWKERPAFYKGLRWFYVVVNTLCIVINLGDAVYFPFSGKRTTWSVFQEFGNEGAGELANVFAVNALTHWYLFIVAGLLAAMLFFAFKAPTDGTGARNLSRTSRDKFAVPSPVEKRYTKKGLAAYYIVQLCSLALLVGLNVGLMRGGFTTAIRPITISNANQYAENPTEAAAVLNTPFSLIRTIDKKPMIVPNYMTDEQAARAFNPVQNENRAQERGAYYGRAKDFNVVVLILESFSKQHIGFYNIEKDENGADGEKSAFTPFLDKLLRDSAYTFRYSYSNGRKSIEAMPPVLASIPNFLEPFFLTPASMNSIAGIARCLSENKGYTSAFFHGAENSSMGFQAFARASGFQNYYGLTEYCQDPKYHAMDDFDGTWAIWDEEYLQYFADQLTEMKKPFMASLFTASSHCPFDLPERYKGKFKRSEDPLQETIMYSDNALRLFFEKARRQPWFNNTIFVLTADHTSGNHDAFYNTSKGLYCVPIILYAPGIPELRGYDEETVVEQADIMPTLLGMLGYDKPYIAFGQDIFATPKEEKFAIHWLPTVDYYEYISGDLLLQFDGEKLRGIYKYRTDPLLKDNLLGRLSHDSIQRQEQQMKAVIQQYMKRMNENSLTPDPSYHPSPSGEGSK